MNHVNRPSSPSLVFAMAVEWDGLNEGSGREEIKAITLKCPVKEKLQHF